jgi:hypothetical protein
MNPANNNASTNLEVLNKIGKITTQSATEGEKTSVHQNKESEEWCLNHEV